MSNIFIQEKMILNLFYGPCKGHLFLLVTTKIIYTCSIKKIVYTYLYTCWTLFRFIFMLFVSLPYFMIVYEKQNFRISS